MTDLLPRRRRDGGRPGRRPTGAESSVGPLWAWPVGGGVAALLASVLLGRVRPATDDAAARLWPGDTSAASSLLQVVATTSITVTTLTFTLTVVALQLASQQFSPRLLRDFARDRVTRSVLTVFVATFVFSLTSLGTLRDGQQVPAVSMLVAVTLALASVVALLGFITHILELLRVDTMMVTVHDESSSALHLFYPPLGDPGPRSPDEVDLVPSAGEVVRSRRSGFVQRVDVDRLVRGAMEHGVVIRLDVRPGDHVVRGTPVATLWVEDGRYRPSEPLVERMGAVVEQAVSTGYERTVEQDAAFGFRQLEDIAVKAVSPGINDPVTAAHAVGHMADLLVELVHRRMGATLHLDRAGRPRAVVPDRDLDYYLELACGQLRRYGSKEPTVLAALLRMLRDLATAVRQDDHVTAVRQAADQVLEALDPFVAARDAQAVRDHHRRVVLALEGSHAQAYADRAGETRSL